LRKRKSPYKHKVRKHMRLGRPVRKYERGKGRKPATPIRVRRRRVVGAPVRGKKPRVEPSGSGSLYDITINYPGGPPDRFDVDARSYMGALDSGIVDRERTVAPKMIRIRGSV